MNLIPEIPLRQIHILVTGAGRGIGKSIAQTLARNGARVMVTDFNEDWANETAEEIRKEGGEAQASKLDVTKTADAEAALNKMLGFWNKLDIWVNNAGVSTMNHFLDLTEKDWDDNMDINAKGIFLCTQVAVRQMIRQPINVNTGLRGKIISTASMASKRGNAPFLAHYVASKFAAMGLTQSMAGELAQYGITANCVCPGYVATSMQERELGWEASLRGVTVEKVKELYIADTPLKRLQVAQDVASVVLFLASPAADFITGEAINVNGGAFMD